MAVANQVLAGFGHEARAAEQTGGAPDRKPNVVWVVIDAARAKNYSLYGYGRETAPNLAEAARAGTVFERAYSQGFYTGPSVSSYMSGRYFPVPSTDLSLRFPSSCFFYGRPSDEAIAPLLFSKNGYRSVCFTQNMAFVSLNSALAKAFDEQSKYTSTHPASKDDAVLAWLKDQKAAEQPFFLYLHRMDCHSPYRCPDRAPFNEWVDPDYDGWRIKDYRVRMNVMEPKGKASPQDVAQLHGLYDGCIRFADQFYGELMDCLDSAGMRENTIVIYTSDHGELLLDDRRLHGHFLKWAGTDESHHIPLVMTGPGIPAGKRVKPVVESADILPTLVDLCGLKTSAVMDGRSLRPAMNGREDATKGYAFTKAACYIAPDHYFYPDIDFRLVFTTDKKKYEFNISEEEARVWDLPDHLAARNKAELPEDGAAAWLERRDRFRERAYASKAAFAMYAPIYYRSENLNALRTPDDKSAGPVLAKPVRQVPEDGRGWFFHRRSKEDVLLVARGGADAPVLPITIAQTFSGDFRVFVELAADSVVRVRLPGEDAFHPPAERHRLAEDAQWAFADCGTLALAHAEPRFELQPESGTVRIRAFLLFPAKPGLWEQVRQDLQSELLSTEEMLEHEEQLRALGYI